MSFQNHQDKHSYIPGIFHENQNSTVCPQPETTAATNSLTVCSWFCSASAACSFCCTLPAWDWWALVFSHEPAHKTDSENPGARPPSCETTFTKDHPDERPPGKRPPWWKTTWWETTFTKDHPHHRPPGQRPPWWKSTFTKDHPHQRPPGKRPPWSDHVPDERPFWWETMHLMKHHHDERPFTWWKTTLIRDHTDERRS